MKKTNFKKVIAAGLTLTMASALAGCGGSGKSQTKTTDPALAKQNVYSYEKLDMGLSSYDQVSILSTNVVDGRLYMAVSAYSWSTENYTNDTFIYSMNTDGSDSKQISLEMPEFTDTEFESTDSGDSESTGNEETSGETSDGNSDNAVLFQTDDGIVDDVATDLDAFYTDDMIDSLDPDDYYYDDSIYESTSLGYINVLDNKCIVGYAEHYVDGFSGDEYVSQDEYLFCYWDENGNCLWSKSATEITGFSYCYINYMCSLDDGSFMTVVNGDENMAIVFDKDGNVIKKKTASELTCLDYIESLTNAGTGRALISFYDPDNNYNTTVAYLDTATLTLKETVSLPESLVTNGFNSLSKGYDTDFVASTETGVCKFNAGDTDVTYFMDYINSDLEGYDIERVTMIDGEHFIGTYSDLETYDTVVALFTYVDPSTIPDKQVITMAVYYLDWDVRSMIVDFNKNSDQYRIVVNSYSQYATDDDYLAGITKLNNEIIAGEGPDMIMMNANIMDFTSYANKDMLADFDELLANDDELKNNTYLTNVFDAFAINGKHYIGIYNFAYYSLLGNSKYFGDKTSWTISDFSELVKTLPADSELLSGMTRDTFLSYLINFDGSEFINLETGECDFNSDDFITMLEYAATLPSSDDISYDDDYYYDYYDQYRSGKVLMMNSYLYDLSWYNENIYECFNGDATLVGFPSRTGDSACISTDGQVIVIMKNGNVDGAWSFARQFFTEDYQTNNIEYDIPVLESAFDAWAAKGLERPYWTDENGEKEYYDITYDVDGVTQTVPVMTQSQVDTLKSQIKSCTKSQYYNSEIISIIEEEASACFSGQKSAKDVADIIQSRVQLYINENQ